MDAQGTVQLVFRGELIAGFRQEDVQRSLGALLKLDEARAGALFSGSRVVLKRGLPAAQAERYVAHLAGLGARVQVEPAPAAPAAADIEPAAGGAAALASTPSLSPSLAPSTAQAHPAPATAPADALGLAGLTLPRHAPSSPPAPLPLLDGGPSAAASSAAQGGARLLAQPEAQATQGASLALEPLAAPGSQPSPFAGPGPADAPPGLALQPAEEEIVCPTCGERQSKRLLCRNCATNMPMGIAAKEEAARLEREQRLAESRGRRGQGAWPGDEAGGMGSSADRGEAAPLLGMGFSGRMGRLQYATAGFGIVAACLFAGVLALKALSSPVLLSVLGLMGLVAVFVYSLRVTVLRLHDVNLSGWWAVLLFLPSLAAQKAPLLSLLTTLASLALMAWPGTRGDNDHGPQPESGSWKALAAALLLLVVGSALVATSARDAMRQFTQMRGARGGADVERSLEQAMVQAVLPPAARSAYERDYRDGPTHKAFAVSSSGAWGWWTGARSQQAAVERALAECDRRREAYAPDCQVVNVDGQWGGDDE